MINMSAILKSGCSAQAVARRAWTCGAEGSLSASISASVPALCTSGCKDGDSPLSGVRFLSHWLRHTSATARSSWTSSQCTAALHMSAGPTAMPAAAAATADRQAAGHHLLDPAIDIPRDRLAKLADELDEPGDRNDRAAARHGRRDRRPKRTACDSSAAVASVSEAGLELPDDTEVKVVFDKLVGNLTKSGKKATARRIVLDAVRVMQKHLRKGDLDNIK